MGFTVPTPTIIKMNVLQNRKTRDALKETNKKGGANNKPANKSTKNKPSRDIPLSDMRSTGGSGTAKTGSSGKSSGEKRSRSSQNGPSSLMSAMDETTHLMALIHAGHQRKPTTGNGSENGAKANNKKAGNAVGGRGGGENTKIKATKETLLGNANASRRPPAQHNDNRIELTPLAADVSNGRDPANVTLNKSRLNKTEDDDATVPLNNSINARAMLNNNGGGDGENAVDRTKTQTNARPTDTGKPPPLSTKDMIQLTEVVNTMVTTRHRPNLAKRIALRILKKVSQKGMERRFNFMFKTCLTLVRH